MQDINVLTNKVLGLAFEVHTQLGAGLLESTYESCLFYELKENNINVERQKKLPIIYKGIQLDTDYRIDLLIDNQLIIELKSVEALQPVHSAQLLTYMKLSNLKYGLLLNFNVPHLKQGIKRFIL
ncbi:MULTISPECIES: GxxExxY protein [Bacteroides]|uniref:GxxExxY protein n=1 Tax=Bacteroides acidifaciens TaxID=85831 RepID=A0A4S2AGU6_9BACE|nr:GxxExxY protein [Bacteroides acidifaciens]MBF0836210.1 GxxExxY protein [Bacteroides acidifaciens]NDO53169.1 GxxExxY protein [Bacteroides acidifaciens]TFU45617.1 GxxExxY protein [Bacteroides acidifaciens]TGY00156.1 GxxExxY protein [Bacteroides acidifaciens]